MYGHTIYVCVCVYSMCMLRHHWHSSCVRLDDADNYAGPSPKPLSQPIRHITRHLCDSTSDIYVTRHLCYSTSDSVPLTRALLGNASQQPAAPSSVALIVLHDLTIGQALFLTYVGLLVYNLSADPQFLRSRWNLTHRRLDMLLVAVALLAQVCVCVYVHVCT